MPGEETGAAPPATGRWARIRRILNAASASIVMALGVLLLMMGAGWLLVWVRLLDPEHLDLFTALTGYPLGFLVGVIVGRYVFRHDVPVSIICHLLAGTTVVSIAAAVLIPADGCGCHSRPLAVRYACETNLSQIGLALEIYANDNGGLCPATLDDLYPSYVTDRSIFECPGGREREYRYIPGLRPGKDSPDRVVAFDAEPCHLDGRNVLFLDRSVDWLQEDVFLWTLRESGSLEGARDGTP